MQHTSSQVQMQITNEFCEPTNVRHLCDWFLFHSTEMFELECGSHSFLFRFGSATMISIFSVHKYLRNDFSLTPVAKPSTPNLLIDFSVLNCFKCSERVNSINGKFIHEFASIEIRGTCLKSKNIMDFSCQRKNIKSFVPLRRASNHNTR